jgi:hypothetical protein
MLTARYLSFGQIGQISGQIGQKNGNIYTVLTPFVASIVDGDNL